MEGESPTLTEDFEKQFTCLGENIETYRTFTVPIQKEVIRIDKKGEETTKNISYTLQFFDNPRFMASTLSNLGKNIPERTQNIKCKYGSNNKKCKTCWIKYKYCHLNTQTLKMI